MVIQAPKFPPNFLWGVATAAYQVEGGNHGSDWSAWESDPKHSHLLSDPVGLACDHYARFEDDIALIAKLGLGAYRFSVEWSRIEPQDGQFDRSEIAHYRAVVEACIRQGVAPIVTLQHFTLPLWVAEMGGWCAPQMPERFARYARKVAQALGAGVAYYCTINEPGNLLTRGYLGTFPTPPFISQIKIYEQAVAGLTASHIAACEALKDVHPHVKVGIAHAVQHWTYTRSSKTLVEYVRGLHEDRFYPASKDDDFIGLQTYTRIEGKLSLIEGIGGGWLTKTAWLTDRILLPMLRKQADAAVAGKADGRRYTEMGYLWAPEAILETARDMAKRFQGKEILITEHGVAATDDKARIEYIEAALGHVATLLSEGLPITGYLHWTLLDNWEWWDGYEPKFGLCAVDRTTFERIPKPSAYRLGEIARTGRVSPP